jgi:2-polyprenyl-6-methoxyphenol hydroxylase-like FAD-dependent oxidoreductase
MTEHAVLIAGGGPTGLMLAAELSLAGVNVAIVERRATQDLVGLRAGGLHARTIEVLDQRGIADRFLSQGKVFRTVGFHMVRLDISDFPTRHNCLLQLFQSQIERILADWVDELGVTIYRGCDVTGFAQDDIGVDVATSDGPSLRAEYLIGCDGGRSLIRKTAGIEFRSLPAYCATRWRRSRSVAWTTTKALADTLSELLAMDQPRRGIAAEMSGLGVHYDLREGHPLLGRRMPDLDLVTANGPRRVFTLLHPARPVLLNLGESGSVDITPWADRVQWIDAKYDGTWELPALGPVKAPTSVLVRPDGYVAWVGDRSQVGLADALTTWFGPPGSA